MSTTLVPERHRLSIHRRSLGKSIPFGRPLYGVRAKCACGLFDHKINEAPSQGGEVRARDAHRLHLQSVLDFMQREDPSLIWATLTHRKFACDCLNADWSKCERKATRRFGNASNSAILVACTQHAKQWGCDQ